MRTSLVEVVNDTSLPALLSVALSLESALALPALAEFLVCETAGVDAGVVPKSDFNPSRLVRRSIPNTPWLPYRPLY
jgi:hypothetical protein